MVNTRKFCYSLNENKIENYTTIPTNTLLNKNPDTKPWVSMSECMYWWIDENAYFYYKGVERDDPEKFYEQHMKSIMPKREEGDPESIAEQGKRFEKETIDIMEKKMGGWIPGKEDDYNTCLKKLKSGEEDILYKFPFKEKRMKVRGEMDFLMKGSKIKENYSSLHKDIIDRLDDDTYYVWDIKFHTLKLLTNGYSVGSDNFYKKTAGQVAGYTMIATKLQNRPIDIGFVLGKDNVVGVFDYSKREKKYMDELPVVFNAVRCSKMYNYLRSIGDEPTLDVNKKYEFDITGTEDKDIYDLGYREYRTNTTEKNNLPICFAYVRKGELILPGGYMNPNTKLKTPPPSRIPHIDMRMHLLRTPGCVFHLLDDIDMEITNKRKFFLDIETVSDKISVIGLYDPQENLYKDFTIFKGCDDKETLTKFQNYINELVEKFGDIEIWEYGDFDEKNLIRNGVYIPEGVTVLNLIKMLEKYMFIPKGLKKWYGLKGMVESMYNQNLTKITYKGLHIDNGREAKIKGDEYYKNGDEEIIQDIIKYNEVDCRATWDIYDFITRRYKQYKKYDSSNIYY